MKDQYGRTIDYVRISVTDRCNLRCIYCMPEEGVCQVRHEDILRYDEIVHLCRIFARMGICKVKLTGGEPLVRKGVPALAGEIKAIPGIESVTLTTNGVLLKEQFPELANAGVDGINVSLDTLDREMFSQIARRDELENVLDGIREGLRYPKIRLKINCVPLENVNEGQWTALASLAKDMDICVRFIEMMPIGLGKTYHGKTQKTVLKRLEEAFGSAVPVQGNFGNGPGVYVQFPGFRGKVGFISAMTHQFCGGCNRIRLTSEGYLKLCLQYTDGMDLRTPLRDGRSDEEIQKLTEAAIFKKRRGHRFTEQPQAGFEGRQMSKIGG